MSYTEHEIEQSQTRLGALLGHNRPPGAVDSAKEFAADLAVFLQENPVIENMPQMKAGDQWEERAVIMLKTLDDERKPKADPLYAQWKAINDSYRVIKEPLEKLLVQIRRRLSIFKLAVEQARIEEANRLRLEAEAKEAAARAAEKAEQDAIACADVGELTDVGGAIAEADATFKDFRQADKAAAIAERNVPVRSASIVGGRSRSMKTRRVLVVADAVAAVRAIGATPEIVAAIVRCAKSFEEAHGELPNGVQETFERSM